MSASTNFGARLKSARAEKKISQASLAKTMGVSKQAVSNWENGQNFPNKKILQLLSATLGCSLNWLLTGSKADLTIDQYSDGEQRGVPVIDYSEALSYSPDQKGFENKSRITPKFAASAGSFALVISDNSMSTEFERGDIVIIDPDITPVPGDKVCAYIDGDDNAIFRVYIADGSDRSHSQKFTLSPLNPTWTKIDVDGNGRIIGVMIEHTKPRRV